MPATPERIAFITQPYRKAISGPDAAVQAAYGDLARETKIDEPIETLFDSIVDTQAIGDARLTLLKAERGRYQVPLPAGLNFALTLDSGSLTETWWNAGSSPAIVCDVMPFGKGGLAVGKDRHSIPCA